MIGDAIIQSLHSRPVATNHQAVAFAQTPGAAACPNVDEVDAVFAQTYPRRMDFL